MTWPLSLIWSIDADADGKTDSPASSVVKKITAAPVELLQHFDNPGLPPSARVGDPTLKQRERQPLSIWQVGRLGAFAAMKASELVSDVVSYHVRGPRRKSWGIEMTLLTSIMRDVGSHSHLGDMALIRMLMSIGGYIPLPSDALATPVTFRVRKRNLRGILADFDAAEDGTRELSGEWVVGKRTWQRLQREWRAVRASSREKEKIKDAGWSSPVSMQHPRRKEIVVLYLHGGAYYVSSAASHRLVTIPLAKNLNARVFALDYRLAPETRFPGPLHDAVSAYLRLVDDLHIPPENIIVAGDSAGGALSLALMMYLRDNDYPLPSAAILMSPWVDLTMSCDSWDSNAEYDIVPRPIPGDHLNPIACYLGEHMEKYLTHPYASPLFGDLKGLPPMLVQAGECEVLRDEITLFAHKAKMSGVEVRHELYADAVHVFQSLPFFKASQQAFLSCRDFVQNFLPQWQQRSPRALEGSTEENLEQEIDNNAARVVRGDGTESISRPEDICGHISATGRTAAKADGGEEEEDVSPSPSEEEMSWSAQLPTPAGSEDENRDDSVLIAASKADREKSKTLLPGQVNPRSSLKRLRSTLSIIAGASYLSATDYFSDPPHEEQGNEPPSPRARSRRSTLSMSSLKPVPPPSIRRSERSHPDVHSLIQQYASSGPVQETATLKSQEYRRRRRSQTMSSINKDS
ncbi:uncharacterized protein LAESUDRAFT_648554 [Laetiporus sulphureus 93-53]|uniref:Alpha/beta hydrolase fold-3 domain-containing protein n=1 Tax=Laetiporus sulphureus 93-53 TaxID=1314785 RepID=A0A165F9S8_9APHY|nr:uncharacterized protein LAESUDRAFT_648554 [Laetiporus sulphureus 93-53]KZT08648.1 hypothetical protein LAESUDRAFT_648554 [Laetiporus sulphureus 93-53]